MENSKSLYPVLFESCRLVKGSKCSVIVDIQRQSYGSLSNEIYDLLLLVDGRSLKDIKSNYNNQFDDIIENNLRIFEKNEILFFTHFPEMFPKMSLQWDEPSIITNAIIDIDLSSKIDYKILWNSLSVLGCEHIQIRCFTNSEIDFAYIMDCISNLRIISIEVLFPYTHTSDTDKWVNMVNKYPRLFSVTLYNAPVTKTVLLSNGKMGHIFWSKDEIINSLSCGKINQGFFNIHIKSFTEAQLHNTCLNRKISIDVNGNIKNCPSMSESFGNIKETTIAEAIEKPDFKKYWNINKDKIHVCKDCEFRYICTDCRSYVEDPEDICSKPLKCGYNPYTGEWEEWSTNPLKQKAIDFYGMREMVTKEND